MSAREYSAMQELLAQAAGAHHQYQQAGADDGMDASMASEPVVYTGPLARAPPPETSAFDLGMSGQAVRQHAPTDYSTMQQQLEMVHSLTSRAQISQPYVAPPSSSNAPKRKAEGAAQQNPFQHSRKQGRKASDMES